MKPDRRSSAMPAGGRVTAAAQPSSPSSVAPSHDAIARRAYLKWQARGCPSGTALQDWLEAESELKGKFGQGRRS
jgi:hypothetical protein